MMPIVMAAPTHALSVGNLLFELFLRANNGGANNKCLQQRWQQQMPGSKSQARVGAMTRAKGMSFQDHRVLCTKLPMRWCL